MEKNKKNIISLPSAEFAHSMAGANKKNSLVLIFNTDRPHDLELMLVLITSLI